MKAKYVEPSSARHQVMVVDGVEQLRIPYYRHWFIMLLPLVFLACWTAGGIVVMYLLAKMREALPAFAFSLWLLVWVFFALLLVFQFGAQTLRVQNGDLEVSNGVGPLSRRRRYRGMDIRNLRSAAPLVVASSMMGAVRFDYGSQTAYLATGVDEPEGRVIADWLARRLPSTATAMD